jgi:hypothetical protein
MRFAGGVLLSFWLVLALSAPGYAAMALQEDEAQAEVLDEGKLKISFAPFNITVFNRGQVRGTADIQIVLQLKENGEYEEINRLKPQLRADISTALTTLSRRRWSLTKPINPDIVSAYLKPFVDYRIGADRVEVYVLRALINPR